MESSQSRPKNPHTKTKTKLQMNQTIEPKMEIAPSMILLTFGIIPVWTSRLYIIVFLIGFTLCMCIVDFLRNCSAKLGAIWTHNMLNIDQTWIMGDTTGRGLTVSLWTELDMSSSPWINYRSGRQRKAWDSKLSRRKIVIISLFLFHHIRLTHGIDIYDTLCINESKLIELAKI